MKTTFVVRGIESVWVDQVRKGGGDANGQAALRRCRFSLSFELSAACHR
ncbi:hypothetical protein [Roseateles sp.]|jgi:hypothetical protein